MMDDSLWASGRSSPGVDSLAREDAFDALRATLAGQLTAGRWKMVEQITDALGAALATSDIAALREAVCALELLGPLRALGFGEKSEESAVSAPESVRERISILIDSLDYPRSIGRQATDEDSDARE